MSLMARLVIGLLTIPLMVLAISSDSRAEAPLVSKMSAYVKSGSGDAWIALAKGKPVDPGQVIEYRINNANKSGSSIRGLVIAGPIPNGTAYVADSAKSAVAAQLEVLIEGEKWQLFPGRKTIKGKDGKPQRIQAGPADYKSLRWKVTGEVPKGAVVKQSYRVRVGG